MARFTVDTGERNLDGGAPIMWMAREALARRTLKEAVDFLRECPRTVPYGFHMAQGGVAVGVECSPSGFTVREVRTDLVTTCDTSYHGVRANHCVIDADMIRREIGAHHLPALGGQDDKSSQARQTSLEQSLALMAARPGGPDVRGV